MERTTEDDARQLHLFAQMKEEGFRVLNSEGRDKFVNVEVHGLEKLCLKYQRFERWRRRLTVQQLQSTEHPGPHPRARPSTIGQLKAQRE